MKMVCFGCRLWSQKTLGTKNDGKRLFFPLFLNRSSIRLLEACTQVVIENAYQNRINTPRAAAAAS
jgi:hypothetical protein